MIDQKSLFLKTELILFMAAPEFGLAKKPGHGIHGAEVYRMDDAFAAFNRFRPPALPDPCIPRHRLLNRYYRAADKRQVMVSASAGWGKTLSTQLWLADCGRKSVWYGLEARDNDPARFYRLFGAGLAFLQPDNPGLEAIYRSPAFAATPVAHALNLVRELVPDAHRHVLVFDDVHLISGGVIPRSLPVVLQALPLSFSVFLLSRGTLSEWTDRAGRSDTDTVVITEMDLAFAPEEIRACFAARHVSLNDAEAADIFNLTQGWAMGVNAMAVGGRTALGGRHERTFSAYINTWIWKKWTRDLRDFMLKTAVLDVFSVDEAEQITNRKDCDRILEKLSASALFLVSLGNGRYRYHPLFLDFLRENRRERARINFPSLHKTLALYRLERGEDAAALLHALLSADDACLTAATIGVFRYSAACTDVSAFAEMFQRHLTCDAESHTRAEILEKHPYLLTLFAWFHYLVGEIRPFLSFLDALYAKLPDISAEHRGFFEGCAMLATLDPRHPPTGKSGKLLAEVTPDETRGLAIQSASLSQNLPFMHRSNRDYSACAADIEGSMAAFGATFAPFLRTDYKAVAAMLRAGLAYEQNHLDAAAEASCRAFAAMTHQTATELRFSAAMILAVVFFAQERKDLMQEILNATHTLLKEKNAPYLLPNLYAVETKIQLADGDTTAASDWLGKFLVSESGPVALYTLPRHFATARSRIVLGETEKAGTILQGVMALSHDFARPLDMAEAGVLLAIVRWRERKTREAVNLLESALEAMQPYGFIRVFVDEGAALLPILKKVVTRVAKAAYDGPLDASHVRAIVAAIRNPSSRRAGLAFSRSGAGVRLSRRQGEILALLDRGFSQADIRQQTGLAIPTIKSHCTLIYSKLGVNNARDALVRARRLGLLAKTENMIYTARRQ